MKGKCSFTSNEHLSIIVTEVYTGERKREELREGGGHRRESVCTELRPLIRRERGGDGADKEGDGKHGFK